jgi:hypothetical protein
MSEVDLRQLAIIQAKNYVGAQWKSKAKTPEEDLTEMRQNMLKFIDEPDEVVCVYAFWNTCWSDPRSDSQKQRGDDCESREIGLSCSMAIDISRPHLAN